MIGLFKRFPELQIPPNRADELRFLEEPPEGGATLLRGPQARFSFHFLCRARTGLSLSSIIGNS